MRSNLELLLLSLVQDGLGTPYELKAHADISLGSAVPALARLEEDGLVKASEVSSRRSRRFTITPRGLKALKNDCAEQLQNTTSDVESVLRIAYLGWRGGSSAAAAKFLEEAAVHLEGLATMAIAEATRFGTRGPNVDSNAMRWLRARVAAQRIQSEVKELRTLANELKKLATKHKPKSKTTRRNDVRKTKITE